MRSSTSASSTHNNWRGTSSGCREDYGAIEVVGHRAVDIPGATATVDYRSQDPAAPLGAPMMRLLDGRYPSAPGEIAVTDGVTAAFHTGLGRTVSFGGGERQASWGRSRTLGTSTTSSHWAALPTSPRQRRDRARAP